MRLFDIFKRKPESAAEKQALENLDEGTREVSAQELEKEAEREHGGEFGDLSLMPHTPAEPLRHVPGDPVPEPVDDPDPADRRGLRDVLHEDDEKK